MFSWHRPSQSVGIFLSCVAALFSGIVLVQILVSSKVPNPYMDEIFHINQTKEYCDKWWQSDWNPKITTPPGLYLTCLALLEPVIFVLPENSREICGSAAVLRYFNALFSAILFCLCFTLLRLQSAGNRTSSVVISAGALNICLFPLVFFFSLLFYTDLCSLCSVLLCYLLQQRRYHHWSALAGLYSCTIRQTNAVWVVFCACLSLVDLAVIHAEYFATNKEKFLALKQNTKQQISAKNNLQWDLHNLSKSNSKIQDQIIDFCDDPIALVETFSEINSIKPNLLINFFTTALYRCSSYLAVGVALLFFVYWNGSIALGDKSAHQSTLHFVQSFYCCAFVAGFGWPLLLEYKKEIWYRLKSHSLFTRLLFLAILGCIYQFTFDHPYLLADNRHYTFYIWRRWFLMHPVNKYILAPLYLISQYAIIASLNRQSVIWRFLFVMSCFAATVPNRLLEFRYFLVPYVIWRLHLPIQSKKVLFVEFFWYFLVNIVTLYLFVQKPFKWPNETGWQRFMW